MFPSLAAGLGLGLSLIVAIGAQNLFVLSQGIRREHVLTVALVCAASDAVLIAVGVSGLGLVLETAPWTVQVARWAGAAFLLAYALLAARRVWRPTDPPAVDATSARDAVPVSPTAADAGSNDSTAVQTSQAVRPVPVRTSRTAALVTCLALTWLNPHVYLDTVFLLGSVANTHGDNRWWFASGAMLASLAWFLSLAYGARLLGRMFTSPITWRVLDGIIAVVMALIALSLVLGG
ncbi:LysE/ArgO family amino acid transporter [Microbacterium neimengense]